jgi:hypothetical protein
MDADYPLVIKASSSKGAWKLVVVTLCFLLFCWMAVVGSGWIRVMYGALAAMMAVIGVGGRNRILGREALLAAGSAGIHHPHLGLIPWDDVTEMRIRPGGYLPGLAISVRDPGIYTARAPSWLRPMIRLDRALKRPLLVLPAKLLVDKPEELKAKLEGIAGRAF